VSTCYTLLAHFTQMQTTRSRIVTIRHTLCRTEWVQSCYKRSQHVTCYQLAQNSFVGFTGKFQYLQILLLLPVLPNNVTCKIHGIHYPQFLLLANSTPFTAKINYLQIQRPPIKHLHKIPTGSRPARALNIGGYKKIRDFLRISRYISQTIQDSAIVTMESE